MDGSDNAQYYQSTSLSVTGDYKTGTLKYYLSMQNVQQPSISTFTNSYISEITLSRYNGGVMYVWAMVEGKKGETIMTCSKGFKLSSFPIISATVDFTAGYYLDAPESGTSIQLNFMNVVINDDKSSDSPTTYTAYYAIAYDDIPVTYKKFNYTKGQKINFKSNNFDVYDVYDNGNRFSVNATLYIKIVDQFSRETVSKYVKTFEF